MDTLDNYLREEVALLVSAARACESGEQEAATGQGQKNNS
jgi:hypothetical protein